MKKYFKFGLLAGVAVAGLGVLSILVNHSKMIKSYGLGNKTSKDLDTDDFESNDVDLDRFSPSKGVDGDDEFLDSRFSL